MTIFRATGRIGKRLVNEALEFGNAVTSVVRDPSTLTVQHANLLIVVAVQARQYNHQLEMRLIDMVSAGLLYRCFGVLLSLMIAAAAMSFSSVSVIANALRLRAAKLA